MRTSLRFFSERRLRSFPAILKLLILIRDVVSQRLLSHAIHKLKEELRHARSLEDQVDLVYTFHQRLKLSPRIGNAFSISPLQRKDEITELLRILKRHKIRALLEIGTARGGTLLLFSRITSPDAIMISIDLPNGYPEWKMPLYRSFASRNQRIHLLRMDSHDDATLRTVKEALGGRKLDFLFIDGDHTYEGVKKDFEMYGKLVKERGIVAFHDVALYAPEIKCEVKKFWLKIKDKYKHREIIKEPNWAGIGILYV